MRKKNKKDVNLNIKADFCKPGKCKCKCSKTGSGCLGMFYFLGFIGAVVYNISVATSFWTGILGFLKAIVWPGFLVFEMMKFLGM